MIESLGWFEDARCCNHEVAGLSHVTCWGKKKKEEEKIECKQAPILKSPGSGAAIERITKPGLILQHMKKPLLNHKNQQIFVSYLPILCNRGEKERKTIKGIELVFFPCFVPTKAWHVLLQISHGCRFPNDK